MLEPNYLQNVGDDLEKLYQELATEILVDIAERIKMNQDAMTSTAEYLNTGSCNRALIKVSAIPSTD